jgi:hypothetical protein
MSALASDGAYQHGDQLFSGLFLKRGAFNQVSFSVDCSTADPATGAWRADGALSLTVNGVTKTIQGVVIPGPADHFVASTFMGGQWRNTVDSSLAISNVGYTTG